MNSVADQVSIMCFFFLVHFLDIYGMPTVSDFLLDVAAFYHYYVVLK